MYNIILAVVLISALSGVILLLNRKRRIVNSIPEILDGENDGLKIKLNPIHFSLPIWVSNLKIRRAALENLAEKGLRRMRVFILRVDNHLTNSIGKLKEEKTIPSSGNDRIEALIVANATPETHQIELGADSKIQNIWLKEQGYLTSLSDGFDTEIFSQLTDLYLNLGDYSTLREQLLRAINADLSWEDIIRDSRLINSLQVLKENSLGYSVKATNRTKTLSPKVHQRKRKIITN